MSERQIRELVSFGSMLDAKVTPINIKGREGVDIMDVQFVDYIAAVLYLQQCQKTWFPDNEYLVA